MEKGGNEIECLAVGRGRADGEEQKEKLMKEEIRSKMGSTEEKAGEGSLGLYEKREER